MLPEVERPLADPAVVVEGRRLFVRRGEGSGEPTGQLLIDFDGAKPQALAMRRSNDDGPMAIPMVAGDALAQTIVARARRASYGAEELRAFAAELEGGGSPEQAVEVYRAVLFSGRFDGRRPVRPGGTVVSWRRFGGRPRTVLHGDRAG